MNRRELDKSGIYMITNLTNGKFYIGSAVSIYGRWAEHRSSLRRGQHSNKHLQRSFDKNGFDSFSFTVEEFCDKERLIEREQFYLDILKPSYNICRKAGSTIGVVPSKEKKDKISKSVKKFRKENPNWRTGENHPLFGKTPHNKGKFGLVKLESRRLKIIRFDLDFNLIKIYDCTVDLEKDGITRGVVRKCCAGEQPVYKNSFWMKQSDYDNIDKRIELLEKFLKEKDWFLTPARKRKKIPKPV